MSSCTVRAVVGPEGLPVPRRALPEMLLLASCRGEEEEAAQPPCGVQSSKGL